MVYGRRGFDPLHIHRCYVTDESSSSEVKRRKLLCKNAMNKDGNRKPRTEVTPHIARGSIINSPSKQVIKH